MVAAKARVQVITFMWSPAIQWLPVEFICHSPICLKKLRQEIYFNVPEFKAILNDKDFKSTFGELATWDMLKRPPKDFPADFPDIELLKYKSYSVAKGLDDNLILSDKFNATVLHACESMRSFNHFLNRSFEG